MDVDKVISVLTHHSRFFNDFDKAEMMEFLKRCTSKNLKEGEVIFKERTRGTELYIIISGSVRVQKAGTVIDRIGSGECFGEMGALSGEERSATAEADGDVILLMTDEKKLGTLNPDTLMKLYKNVLLLVSERLRKRIEEKSSAMRTGN